MPTLLPSRIWQTSGSTTQIRTRAVAEARHRIVVVGAGAGGLELATRLGNKLGRRGKAHITRIDKAHRHLWKLLVHEIAAGSMDEDVHAIDYLAQAYWQGFVYCAGALTGIDRARRLVQVAPFSSECTQGKPLEAEQLQVAIIGAGATAPSWPPSCTRPRASLSPTASTTSMRTRTSRST